MSMFRMPKPRPFHHEMIYQGRARREQDDGSRFHFAAKRCKPKQVVAWPLILLALVAVLLVFLFYM